jgi:hypothetical protein
MDETLVDGVISESLTALNAASSSYLAEVAAGSFSGLSDADLLAELRTRELVARRQAVADQELLAELDRRGVAARLSMPSTAAVLQAMLRVSPPEAKRRVQDAARFAHRLTATGEAQAPVRPLVAQAQAVGDMSIEQARTIAKVLERIPITVTVEDVTDAEQALVQAADTLRPYQLGQLGERILAWLDPDGTLASDAEQQRRRRLTLAPRSDGTYAMSGELTAACGATLTALLSAHAAPQPATDGTPDPRSHGQRMHDALELLAGFEIRHRTLHTSGTAAELIITMTAEQLATRTGYAQTSFGQLLSIDQALALADEASLTFLTRQANGAVLDERRTKRIATRAQTLALIARDKGCSFPDCDKPPEWTQRHHIRAWMDGGPTDLDNLTLLCGPHHRSFEQQGWTCLVKDKLPWWIPPAWIDPHQKPRQNHRISRQ